MQIQKDFEGWNVEKKKLHYQEKEPPFFNEREIWWCSLGANIGHEQDGKNENFERPVLVFRKFSKHLLWVFPISSKIKTDKHYLSIQYKGGTRSVLLSQMRVISSRRILRKIQTLNPKDFSDIEIKFIDLLIKRNPPNVGGNLGGRSPL